MVLTKRDLDLFQKMQSYAIFTTKQVWELVFPGVRLTTVLRRLRKLERGFYVQRITGLDGGEFTWALLPKGAELVGMGVFKRHFRRDLLEHDVELTVLRLWLEGHGIARSWIPEHEIRSRVAKRHGLREMKRRVVPDGIMGCEIGNLKESISIELELTYKNSGRYFRAFNDYQNKTSLWGIWYFVQSHGLGKQVEKMWRRATPYGSGIRFLWSILDDVHSMGFEAKIHGDGEGRKVSEIFAAGSPKTAHTPAQRVSNQGSLEMENMTDLNLENETEILAPAS